jgi:hypothetical protein
MKLNIQKLDERIRKLQQVREMLADPEMAAIVMELISEGQPGPPTHQEAEDLEVAPELQVTDILKDAAFSDEASGAGGGLWGLRRK